MRQENAPPGRGQERGQNLLWQDAEKTFENARTVAGRGAISRGASRTEPRIWGYVRGQTYTGTKKELTARKNALQTCTLSANNETFSELSQNPESSLLYRQFSINEPADTFLFSAAPPAVLRHTSLGT